MTIKEFFEVNKSKYANIELLYKQDIYHSLEAIDSHILEQDMDNVSVYELDCVSYVQWMHNEDIDRLDWVSSYFSPDEEVSEKLLKIGRDLYGYNKNDIFCVLKLVVTIE